MSYHVLTLAKIRVIWEHRTPYKLVPYIDVFFQKVICYLLTQIHKDEIRFKLSSAFFFRNMDKYVYSALPVSFELDTTRHWPFLSDVYAGESNKSHTGGKRVSNLILEK